MLVSSSTYPTRSWRNGRCPICGAPNCTCGGPSTSNGVTVTEAPKQQGPLVTVDLGGGRGMKMTEQQANKMRQPAQNKAPSPMSPEGRRNTGSKAGSKG